MLSSCNLGEVSSWVAGLYFPSDFLFFLAMIRNTSTAMMAMKRMPPTTGPTMSAMSPPRKGD